MHIPPSPNVAPRTSEFANLQRAARLIAQRFVPGSVVDVKRLASGVMTIKFAVYYADGTRCIVRFYPKSRSNIVDFEPELIRRCAAQGLAVPEVLGDSRDGPGAPLAYVVYRMIPGVPLAERLEDMSATALHRMALKVATFLQSMGNIPIEGWGELSDSWHGSFNTWSSFLVETCEIGISGIEQRRVLGEDRFRQLRQVCARISDFSPPSNPGLAWGDLSPDNIIVNENDGISGFVDFEGVLVAEPLLSLGYLRARAPRSPFYEALISAWPGGINMRELRRIELYAVIRALRLMKYAAQPLPTDSPRTPVDAYLPGAMEALATLCDNPDFGNEFI